MSLARASLGHDAPPDAAAPGRAVHRRPHTKDQGWARYRGDVLGLSLVVAATLAYFSPALKDGFSFGPFDLGAVLTVGHAHVAVHDRLNGDLITQMIPWNTLDWRLVHAGQIPLWNSFTLLGSPQLFNFESAVASLPDLVGYLFPLSASFFAAVVIKVLIAGTGTYVCCRVLGARPVAASFGGISFMLSGGFVNWLGWSLSDVLAWTGWICALSILVYRDGRRRDVVALVLAVAFACYGGFPEAYVLLGFAVVALIGVTGAVTVAIGRSLAWRGVARLVVTAVAGIVLAAPLLWPGAQLLAGSVRSGIAARDTTFHASLMSLLVAPGYYGLPIHGSIWFGPQDYFETVAYVGLVALVLAVVAIATSWKRPAVAGLIALTAVALVLSYHVGNFDPGARLVDALGLGVVETTRARALIGFGVAVLGALGLERLLRRPDRTTRVAFAGGSVVVALIVCALVVASVSEHLDSVAGPERFDSLVWPVATSVALLVVAAGILVAGRANRPFRPVVGGMLGLVLVGAQGATLVAAGVGINSYSKTFLPANPALSTLSRRVGTSVVGLDGAIRGTPRVWNQVGLYPNINVGYSLAEFAGHDPLLPKPYFTSYPSLAGVVPARSSVLVPDLSSAAEARAYGISWLLVAPSRPAPAGTRFVTSVGDERLYFVPGSARFSFIPGSPGAAVESWHQSSDRSYVVSLVASRAARLVLQLTDVPGWHVTTGGRSLAIDRCGAVAMSVVVPAGRHRLTISYWPSRFSEGLLAAGAAVLGLGVYVSWPLFASRRRRRTPRDSN